MKKRTSGLALVMEPDADHRATLGSALSLEGHRVESMSDCASVLEWCARTGPAPDDIVLALGAGAPDPGWKSLRRALDDDWVLSRVALIVLLTIRDGLTFPKRARVLQKPFAMDELLALVAADVAAAE